ncbi:MAG: hypothetical protein K8R77_01370 [Anaerolineaceae bacterium]|nr:hypothetical protein [Anaerolineaceae bacterium]
MPEPALTKERETVFRKAAVYSRLILRLILDPRVSLFLKALPFGSLLYLVLPDLFPFIVDDALVLGLGVYLFIALCPQEVVQEHLAEMQNRNQTAASTTVDG